MAFIICKCLSCGSLTNVLFTENMNRFPWMTVGSQIKIPTGTLPCHWYPQEDMFYNFSIFSFFLQAMAHNWKYEYTKSYLLEIGWCNINTVVSYVTIHCFHMLCFQSYILWSIYFLFCVWEIAQPCTKGTQEGKEQLSTFIYFWVWVVVRWWLTSG